MDIDGYGLLASLLVSTVGFVVFRYGRLQQRFPQVVIGIALMVFPYFVSGALWTLVVAGVLLLSLWGAVRYGL